MSGGRMPKPRKDRAASMRIANATASVPATMMGPAALGSRWRKIMRASEAPIARQASMNSCSRSDSTTPRTTREVAVHPKIPMMSATAHQVVPPRTFPAIAVRNMAEVTRFEWEPTWLRNAPGPRGSPGVAPRAFASPFTTGIHIVGLNDAQGKKATIRNGVQALTKQTVRPTLFSIENLRFEQPLFSAISILGAGPASSIKISGVNIVGVRTFLFPAFNARFREGIALSSALAELQYARANRNQLMVQKLNDLGIPRSVLVYINYPTDFDSTKTQTALEGTGISVPPLPSYAERLWDYWERNLDPDLFRDRSLAGAVADKVVLITGASSGIGRAAAVKIAEAGGIVLLVARTPEKLEETRAEILERGGAAHIHPCDLSDIDDIDRLVAAARKDVAAGAAQAALARLDEALGLWRGEPLADVEGSDLGKLLVSEGALLFVAAQAGGRVLGVTAQGPTLAEARAKAYANVERLHFEGMHYRRDISLQE